MTLRFSLSHWQASEPARIRDTLELFHFFSSSRLVFLVFALGPCAGIVTGMPVSLRVSVFKLTRNVCSVVILEYGRLETLESRQDLVS
jgi:hypothetical protein